LATSDEAWIFVRLPSAAIPPTEVDHAEKGFKELSSATGPGEGFLSKQFGSRCVSIDTCLCVWYLWKKGEWLSVLSGQALADACIRGMIASVIDAGAMSPIFSSLESM
jgi:hypothetical protein